MKIVSTFFSLFRGFEDSGVAPFPLLGIWGVCFIVYKAFVSPDRRISVGAKSHIPPFLILTSTMIHLLHCDGNELNSSISSALAIRTKMASYLLSLAVSAKLALSTYLSLYLYRKEKQCNSIGSNDGNSQTEIPKTQESGIITVWKAKKSLGLSEYLECAFWFLYPATSILCYQILIYPISDKFSLPEISKYVPSNLIVHTEGLSYMIKHWPHLDPIACNDIHKACIFIAVPFNWIFNFFLAKENSKWSLLKTNPNRKLNTIMNWAIFPATFISLSSGLHFHRENGIIPEMICLATSFLMSDLLMFSWMSNIVIAGRSDTSPDKK